MTTKGRNVKCEENLTVDHLEKAKNYFSESEMDLILNTAKKSRHGTRNNLIILLMYRHGLRVSELINMRIADVNLKQARVKINRIKNGLSVEQPIDGLELRAIKRYLKTRDDKLPWLFLSERRLPLTRQAINYLVSSVVKRSGLGKGNPHMFRHSCGYYLANQGYDIRLIQDYLGHRDPKHTVIYTRTASKRFEGLWK